MQHLFNTLNFRFDPLSIPYDVELPHSRVPSEHWNSELVNLLATHNLKIDNVECFRRNAGEPLRVHVDYENRGSEIIRINWVYGGRGSFMNWFQIKNEDVKSTTFISEANLPYTTYELNDVERIATYLTKPNIPFLVQAGVPHNVHNFFEHRVCISALIIDTEGTVLTMKEAQKRLAEYIVS